jgi:hypothetical protein
VPGWVRRGLDPSTAAGARRDRPAFLELDAKHETMGSISNERTFSADVGDRGKVERQLLALCERVCWRARRRETRARTVSLKVRYSDFETLTRTLDRPTNEEKHVYAAVRRLLDEAWTRPRALRLVGVALSNLSEDLAHVAEVVVSDARGDGRVSAPQRVGVDGGVDVLVVVLVPELEPGLQPHPQQPRAPGDLTRAPASGEQLPLVDEAHRGDAVVAHRVQQLLREQAQARHVVRDGRPGRQVVEGHGDRTLRRASVGRCRNARRQGQRREHARSGHSPW